MNESRIEGVHVQTLTRHESSTGFFSEIIRCTEETFRCGFGQLSHSQVYPGVIKGWHFHRYQTQFTYVALGLLRVVLHDGRPDSSTYRNRIEFLAGDRQTPVCYSFPPGVMHGYRCLEGPAHVIYVTSGVYDLSDELRIPHDDPSVGYQW